MTNVRKILAGCSVLLMAVLAACADQPVAPRAAADGAHVSENTSTGPLAVSISGPPKVISAGTYYWQTGATGGHGTYTYVWERRPVGGTTWTYVGSGSDYYGAVASGSSFELRVTAYSGGLSGSATYTVTVAFLAAAISGPSSVNAGTSATWTGSSTGGFDYYPHMFQWYYRPANSSTWTYAAYGDTYTRSITTSSPTAFYLRLTVSSGDVTVTTDQYVQVSGSTGGGGGGGGGGGCMTCPVEN